MNIELIQESEKKDNGLLKIELT